MWLGTRKWCPLVTSDKAGEDAASSSDFIKAIVVYIGEHYEQMSQTKNKQKNNNNNNTHTHTLWADESPTVPYKQNKQGLITPPGEEF